VADIRERGFLKDFPGVYRRLRQRGFETTLLFLEARDEVLVRRFSESRRPHPLASGRAVLDAVRAERSALEPIRLLADQILDTSEMTVHRLRQQILEHLLSRKPPGAIFRVAFGYKYGVPVTPIWVRRAFRPTRTSNLRGKDGNDARSRRFSGLIRIRRVSGAAGVVVRYLIPKYSEEDT
jgi:UPF0042 nucleotide-binding protein